MTADPSAPGPLVVGYARGQPERFALAIARGDPEAAEALLSRLPYEVLPVVVVHLPPSVADRFVDGIADETLRRWLSQPDLDVAVRLARGLEARRYAGLAAALPPRRRRQLDRHRAFPDGVAGALVDVNAPRIRAAASVADAARELRARKATERTPLLVVDATDRLLGWFDAEQALQYGDRGRVGDCVAPSRALPATADVRAARDEFTRRGQSWLPVADAEGRLLGVLHRSALPGVAPRRDTDGSASVAVLTTMMFELLAELPALVAPGKPKS